MNTKTAKKRYGLAVLALRDPHSQYPINRSTHSKKLQIPPFLLAQRPFSSAESTPPTNPSSRLNRTPSTSNTSASLSPQTVNQSTTSAPQCQSTSLPFTIPTSTNP